MEISNLKVHEASMYDQKWINENPGCNLGKNAWRVLLYVQSYMLLWNTIKIRCRKKLQRDENLMKNTVVSLHQMILSTNGMELNTIIKSCQEQYV